MQVSFYFKDEGKCSPIGYQDITIHVVFYVKIDLIRKTHFVEEVSWTEPPTSDTYESMETRDGVCVALILVPLNNIDDLSVDIHGTYLNSPCKWNIWFQAEV